MNKNVDPKQLVPISSMVGEDDEETAQLGSILQDARSYLKGFSWCHDIRDEHYGLGVGGVVGIFLFEIDADPGADPTLWVVAGDLPSAYLVTDEAATPCAALGVYCDIMDRWIRTVRSGGQLSEVFPVGVDPTEANAAQLEKRVIFLRNEIIPAFE